jgi:DNA-binding NarL/FixJ family response regulator
VIRVLVADDQSLVRGGFRMIVDSQPDLEVVGEASDGREALALTAEHEPDVVLMDIRMPGMNGLEATRAIVARPDCHARVLMLTTFDLDELVYESVRAGASGFLVKDVPPQELAQAVRTVASGNALLSPTALRRLLDEFVRRPAPVAGRPRGLETLTDREVDVLRLVARGRTNAEIASELLVGENTVKTHVTHLLTKLCLRDRVQAVVRAYETGLVAPGRDDG